MSAAFVFQCGEEAGETLLNISRAWENAETSVSAALVSKLPQLVGSLTSNNKSGKFAVIPLSVVFFVFVKTSVLVLTDFGLTAS